MEQETTSSEEKRAVIREYVHKQRRAMSIFPDDLVCGSVPEGSCQDGREWLNFVERQLVFTREGLGDWQLLSDPEVLEAAYRYVVEGKRS